MLLAAGGVAFEGFLKAPRPRWLRPAVIAVMVAGGVVTAPLFLPVLAPETYVVYASALHFQEPHMERGTQAPMPQVFADQFGWEGKVQDVHLILPRLRSALAAIVPDHRRF